MARKNKGKIEIRDRIKELRRVPASELLANPKNPRRHPEAQRKAMQAALEKVGYADALIGRETEGGIELLDGHLRKDISPDQEVPVLIVDLDDQEAALFLASFDPLTNMAENEQTKMDELLSEVGKQDEALQAMLDDLASPEPEETELRQLDTKPPPKMAWVLIGIPLTSYGEIAHLVDAAAEAPKAIVETTYNDDDPNEKY